MTIAPVADVKTHFSRFLVECENGPVIVTKNGRPAAILVAITDADEIERFVLAHTPRFRVLLDAAHRRARKTGVPHEEFWKKAQGK